MTGTPPSFADTPGSPAAEGPDALSDMLRAVRLTGSVFLSARFTAPFGVVSPQRYDERMPMAHLRHISIFHLIAAGGCTVETASGQRREVKAGDLLLMPFARRAQVPERRCGGDGVRLRHRSPGRDRGHMDGEPRRRRAETRMVCGFIELSEFLFAPLFRSLPELLVERADEDRIGAMIASTVREILALVDAARPGTQMMLGRLMELLFVEVLRRHATRLPAGSKGWFAALNDPVVARALVLVHANPARRWTADDLAREAGTSRTVLAERFKALLGRPPIDYVTGWRIQLAADRLRNGRDGIASIAAEVGYELEAAFNRAFKRVTGITPGRWREGAGDSPAR